MELERKIRDVCYVKKKRNVFRPCCAMPQECVGVMCGRQWKEMEIWMHEKPVKGDIICDVSQVAHNLY